MQALPTMLSRSDREAMSQIALSDLNAASFDDFVAVLENVVEYSPWIAQEAAARRPFAGINSLLDAIKAAIASAEPEVQLALIRAHPDLANKTQRAADLTAQSTAEQSSAGLDRLSEPNMRPSSGRTMRIAKNLVFLISSARAGTPRIPFCVTSSRDCRTLPRPRHAVRSRKSPASLRCGWTSSSVLTTS